MRIVVCLFSPIVLIASHSESQSAQYTIPTVREVEAKSGKPVLVGAFYDCRNHVPYSGTAFVQHGTVTMKSLTINQCGNPKEPANAYWYTSEPGFKGLDEVNFSYTSGSALIVHVTVR